MSSSLSPMSRVMGSLGDKSGVEDVLEAEENDKSA